MRGSYRVPAIAGAAFSLLLCAGCLREPAGPADQAGTKQPYDPVLARKLDSMARAADSLRAGLTRLRASDTAVPDPYSADLARLAAGMRRLPVPLGTRYDAAPKPAPKSSAAAGCRGDADIIGLKDSATGLLGIDTMVFYDLAGGPHCRPPVPVARETHQRWVFEPGTGESREHIRLDIVQDNLFPRYSYRGTGRISLFSGLEFAITRWDVEMILDNTLEQMIIQDAVLELAWKDGYVLKLGLAAPRPIRGLDLFPIWDRLPGKTLKLTGPILKGGEIAGYADLFADRTVAIRDRHGARLP